ncbi:TetR/AcrR family transcriptional regulator [Leucobacter soli]|uniref:HTH-type transcriptional regulator BetI n=1 Tax=Leucobacter soli TaxID=2812850 RepID=A0A916NH64_9MICO|nr:TetR family transcriptional regulator [Leucobacter soli]CAG7612207.1 HTH-type transcriptional regulator BetI [Leucobacter soli]
MAEKIDRAGRLIDATREVIEEEGIRGVTYRKVAKRAGESLGLTSYYFPTIQSLLEATMRKTMDQQVEAAEQWFTAHLDGDPAEVVTEWFSARTSDLESVRRGYELYLAAVSMPELRPIATEWFRALTGAIDIVVQNPRASFVIDAMLDASFLRVLLAGAEGTVDLAEIRESIRQIIAMQNGRTGEAVPA